MRNAGQHAPAWPPHWPGFADRKRAVRTGFERYFRPDASELAELWDSGLIVLDANVLLDLYRMGTAASSDLLSILEGAANRIWLPHQVAFEFHRSRISVIAKERDMFRGLRKDLETAKESMKQLWIQRPHVPTDRKASDAELTTAFKSAETWLSKQEKKHPPELKDLRSMSEDRILAKLVELYEGRIGPEPDEADLTAMHAQGKARYEQKIPPGYRDGNKDGPAAFGDFILWEQTLRHADTAKKNVILVTRDQKEDWWVINEGKIVGPRPELIHEFAKRTGRSFYLYSRSEFAKHAKARPDTLEEVAGLERRDAKSEEQETVIQVISALESGLPARTTTFGPLGSITDENRARIAAALKPALSQDEMARIAAALKPALSQDAMARIVAALKPALSQDAMAKLGELFTRRDPRGKGLGSTDEGGAKG